MTSRNKIQVSPDGTTIFVECYDTANVFSLCKYVIGATTVTCLPFSGQKGRTFSYDGASHAVLINRNDVSPFDYRFIRANINDGSISWNYRIACPIAS